MTPYVKVRVQRVSVWIYVVALIAGFSIGVVVGMWLVTLAR
jgi:hypothetical protein